MLKSKRVDFWSEEERMYYLVDTAKDEIVSLVADCITLVIFIVLASLVLNLISDRSFTNGYLKKDNTYIKIEQFNLGTFLDSLLADQLTYYGLLTGELTYAIAASEEKKDAELFSTKDYKKYKKSFKKNPDTVGWISIGGLIVDYPIV